MKLAQTFLLKLDIWDLDVVIHISRMRWFRHVERGTGLSVFKTNCSCTEETWQV